MENPKKVDIICAGRFHLFEQAKQLQKHGLLYKLITDYPSLKARRWGISKSYLKTRPHRAAINLLKLKVGSYFGGKLQSRLIESIHKGFSKSIYDSLSNDTNIVISHSSFMLEGINSIQSDGRIAIVDHGSLHEKQVRDILLEECNTYGFSEFGNWRYDWLIDREQEEFILADYIFCCSTLAKRSLISNGCHESKIFSNPMGTDLANFWPEQKLDKKFRIVFCGAINPMKGIHYLLKAFNELALPNSELWIVGAGGRDPRLKAIIRRNSNKNIIFKGTFPQNKLRELYVQSSVFILPSLADGWGMVVLQALACGLPVIVTNMTGASEAVANGLNGFVIPSRSVDAIKDKILILYEDSDLRKEMADSSVKSVKNDFTWDSYGNRLATFLEEEINCPQFSN